MMSEFLLIATRPLRWWPNTGKTALLSKLRVAAKAVADDHSPSHSGKPRHSRIRNLAFVGHVLGNSNEEASLRDLLTDHLGPSIEITEASIQAWISYAARQMVEHLLARPPPLHLFSHRLVSWNVTSLHDLDAPGNKKKIRLIKMHLAKGPVFLQETKWDSTQAGLLQQNLGTIQILSSPGLPGEDGTVSGGVAILLPTYLSGVAVKVTEIVPGHILQVEVGERGQNRTYVSVYLHPTKQLDMLLKWENFWAANPPMGNLYIGGDFNQINHGGGRLRLAFDLFVCKFNLFDTSNSEELDKPARAEEEGTFRNANGGKSLLDRWLIRDPLFTKGGLKASIKKWWMSRMKVQHARIQLSVSNIEHDNDDTLPAFEAIPFAALTKANPSYLELERRMDRLEPERSAQAHTDKVHGVIWAWWRGNPKGTYLHISRPELVLRRIARSVGKEVLVPRPEFHLLLTHIKHSVTVRDLTVKDGKYLIPINLLHELLHRYDMWEIQQTHFWEQHSTTQAMHGVPKVPLLYKRLKTLSPKATQSLNCLKNKEGALVTTPLDIDRATRDTRMFWEDTPCDLPTHLLSTLEDYQRHATPFPMLPPPSSEHHRQTILRTGNSAPGVDGLPFAALRVLPGKSAELLTWMLEDILVEEPDLRPPQQLLVWIPKNDIGEYADNFRPLGMPNAIGRTLSASIYSYVASTVKELLHPAQALLNDFREPQGNFLDIQNLLDVITDGKTLSGALLTDLEKAFEYVHPDWIIAVLQHRAAPLWLIAYVRYTLYGRISRPKVKGKMLPSIFLKVGVDMGSALSPLFFCLALDPLIRRLNEIPGVVRGRCYMDDNATFFTTQEAVEAMQLTFEEYRPAGLRVKQHRCCFFLTTKGRQVGDGLASWARAAAQTLRQSREKWFIASGESIRVSRKRVRSLARGTEKKLLLHLITKPCGCGCKTGVIPTHKISLNQIVQMDASRWGGKLLQSCITALGLPMHSPLKNILPSGRSFQPVPRRKRNRGKFQASELTALAHKKNQASIACREGRLNETISPLYQRCSFFSMWILSTSHYASTVFPPMSSQIAFRVRAFQKVSFKRAWIQGKHAQATLRIARIASGPTVQGAQLGAQIGFAIRRDGKKFLWNTARELQHKKGSTGSGRQRLAVIRMLINVQHWHPHKKSVVEALRADQTSNRASATLVKWFKEAFKAKEDHEALDYLETKIGNCRWLPTLDPRKCFELLQSVSAKLIPPVPRQALIRWWLREEADQHFHNHSVDIHTTNAPCFCGCGAGQYRPHGMNGQTAAACHFDRADGAPTAVWLHATTEQVKTRLRQFFTLPNTNPTGQAAYLRSCGETDTCPRCWLCQQGDNSVEHWITFCPVTNAVLSILLQRASTPSDWFPCRGQTDAVNSLLVVTHTVHTLRQHLLAADVFAPPRENIPRTRHIPVLEIITTIGAEIWRALPLVYTVGKSNPWASCLLIKECTEARIQGITTRTAPQLSGPPGPRKRARRIVLVAGTAIPKDLVVLASHTPYAQSTGLWIQGAFFPPPLHSGVDNECNIGQCCRLCSCGKLIYSLISVKTITKGEPLVAKEHGMHLREGTYLVAQFDGSCHFAGTSFPAAGCGVVLWKVQDGKATALKQWSVPLPGVISAPQSEAAGSAHAIKIMADWIEGHPSEVYDFFLIQGDNLAVINSWAGRGTLKQTAMHDLLADAYRIARYSLVNLEWEYIPRDINKHADYLAGIASQLVKETNCLTQQNALAPSEEVAPFTFDEDSWQANAIKALTQQHKEVLLVERIQDITHLAGNLRARMPDRCRGLPAVLANQHNIGASTAYPVIYRTNNEGAQGRSYPWTPHAIFKSSKTIRTLATGGTHVELDVVGAHLTFALVIAPSLARRFRWKTVARARIALQERLRGTAFATNNPTYYKDILTIALNVDKAKHVAMLRTQGLFFTDPLINEMLNVIDEAKPEIISQATRMGFLRQDPRVNQGNAVYFALEFVEGWFMRSFIASILKSTKVTSMVWIHDGILVAPPPTNGARQEAATAANATLKALLFKHTSTTSATPVVIGCDTQAYARDLIIKFILQGSDKDSLRPAPAESQCEILEYLYEYDYALLERTTDAQQASSCTARLKQPGKRKLESHDTPGTIAKYCRRQGITPT
jgi:hypothetical protein